MLKNLFKIMAVLLGCVLVWKGVYALFIDPSSLDSLVVNTSSSYRKSLGLDRLLASIINGSPYKKAVMLLAMGGAFLFYAYWEHKKSVNNNRQGRKRRSSQMKQGTGERKPRRSSEQP